MCNIVYAILLVATIEARFLNGPGTYQLPTISFQWVLKNEPGQAGFVYPTNGEAAITFSDAIGNAAGTWDFIIPESEIPHTSYITNSQGMDTLSDETFIASVANFMASVPTHNAGDADAGPVRLKRKSILQYKNGEFRPMLCSPRLCLSERSFDEHEPILHTMS